ncbi:hypothetical protein LTR28_013506 [Elasticomyces elasticus]|nr:hypothetical protein LTR28_013506 [Elasticomyces elasticus]
MTTQESDENQKSQMPKDAKGGLPSGRPGNDRDMAAAVLFCASCQIPDPDGHLSMPQCSGNGSEKPSQAKAGQEIEKRL